MRKSLRLAAVLATVVACSPHTAPPMTPIVSTSSSTSPSSSTTASGAPFASPPAALDASPTVPRPILDIAPATLAWGGEHGPILSLDATGYMSISRDKSAFLLVPFARLTAAGEILRTDGSTLATIDDAGNILLEGHDYGFKIKRDGTAWQRGGKLAPAIAEDGTVSGIDPETAGMTTHTDMKYVGPSATRRAMILAKIAWAVWIGDEPDPVAPGKARPTSIAACDAYRAMTNKARACVTRDATWTERLRTANARIDGYGTELPPWGPDAIAAACELGTTRLKAYFATRNCAL